MLSSEIGAIELNENEYKLDSEFWNAFETPEETATIPSLEVPQADNFEIVRIVLQAVDSGADIKPEITAYIENETGDTWDPRQADYYGIAGWLLGFLHKEQRVEIDGKRVRRWGLTRAGEEYIELLDRGEFQRAQERLHDAIRSVEVVSRIYKELEDEDALLRQEISDILAEETDLGGSTVPRRAQTVAQWLATLPEVETSGSGPTEKFRIVRE